MILVAPRADQAGSRIGADFIEAVKLPADQQSELTKSVVIQLAKNQVPTAADAERIALNFVTQSGGLDMRDGIAATGLFFIGRDIPSFAATRDLVWEVRVVRMGALLMQIVWVSTTTKAVKVIFGS
jgi:hypothetical protein